MVANLTMGENRFTKAINDKKNRSSLGVAVVGAGRNDENVTPQPQIEHIDIDLMDDNPENIGYSIEGIEDLAENIKENKLQHNLEVRPTADGRYRIISGHRRRLALKWLFENTSFDEYKYPYTLVRYDITNDLDEHLALHKAAADDRKESEAEKMYRAKQLMEIYKAKKARGDKIAGVLRDLVGEDMGIDGSQVQRLIQMNEQLIPEMRELIEEGLIAGTTALVFKNRPEDEQRIIAANIRDAHSRGIELTREQAKQLNQEMKIQNEDLIKKLDRLSKEFNESKKQIKKIKDEKESLKNMLENQDSEEEQEDSKLIMANIEVDFLVKQSKDILTELIHKVSGLKTVNGIALSDESKKEVKEIQSRLIELLNI